MRSSFCTLKWQGSGGMPHQRHARVVGLENHGVQLALLVNLPAAVVEARVEAEEHLRQDRSASSPAGVSRCRTTGSPPRRNAGACWSAGAHWKNRSSKSSGSSGWRSFIHLSS